MLRGVDWRADDDLDALSNEQLLGALAHATGDDPVDTALSEPGGQQAGLVRWGVDVLTAAQSLGRGIDVEQGEAGAMAEMNGEVAVGEGNGETHGQAP